MTLRDEEIRRIAEIMYDSHRGIGAWKRAEHKDQCFFLHDATAAYDAMGTPKLLAALQDKLKHYEYDAAQDTEPKEFSDAIKSAMPAGHSPELELATQLVSERHKKGDLIELVHWLLKSRDTLQEQTRWRVWPEEKPGLYDYVLLMSPNPRMFYGSLDVVEYRSEDRWVAAAHEQSYPCEEGDLWQPITMPEGL